VNACKCKDTTVTTTGPHPIGESDFAALVAAVKEAVSEALGQPSPQTLTQPDAMKYVGLSRSSWFRAKAAGELPGPILIEGSGERWRKKDLDTWLERLKPRNRR
jgi:predicted DNA-binding transcriptional regulator AlpA